MDRVFIRIFTFGILFRMSTCMRPSEETICPDAWTFMYRSCFAEFGPMAYCEAVKYCSDHGGHLLSMDELLLYAGDLHFKQQILRSASDGMYWCVLLDIVHNTTQSQLTEAECTSNHAFVCELGLWYPVENSHLLIRPVPIPMAYAKKWCTNLQLHCNQTGGHIFVWNETIVHQLSQMAIIRNETFYIVTNRSLCNVMQGGEIIQCNYAASDEDCEDRFKKATHVICERVNTHWRTTILSTTKHDWPPEDTTTLPTTERPPFSKTAEVSPSTPMTVSPSYSTSTTNDGFLTQPHHSKAQSQAEEEDFTTLGQATERTLSQQKQKPNSIGVYAGGAVAAFVALALVVGIAVFVVLRKRKSRESQKRNDFHNLTYNENGTTIHGNIVPNNITVQEAAPPAYAEISPASPRGQHELPDDHDYEEPPPVPNKQPDLVIFDNNNVNYSEIRRVSSNDNSGLKISENGLYGGSTSGLDVNETVMKDNDVYAGSVRHNANSAVVLNRGFDGYETVMLDNEVYSASNSDTSKTDLAEGGDVVMKENDLYGDAKNDDLKSTDPKDGLVMTENNLYGSNGNVEENKAIEGDGVAKNNEPFYFEVDPKFVKP